MKTLRGFTLVELLVAIVVMSMLALLSWRSLDGMTRTQTITQQRADDL
jgi:general secretion pathway protein J